MGLLRTILALIVVAGHVPFVDPVWGVGNVLAVKAFFCISGFYMALVLSEKYAGTTIQFYVNRMFRLLPLHLLILGVCLVLALQAPGWNYAPQLSMAPWQTLLDRPELGWLTIGLAISNVLLLGADWTLLGCLSTEASRLFLAGIKSTCQSEPGLPLHHFLLNPPSWTIGIELSFYLVAPFLVRRHLRTLLVLTSLAIVPQLWLISSGFDDPPYNRSVFLFELVYFLFGILSYRLYTALEARQIDRRITWTVGIIGIAATVLTPVPMLYLPLLVVAIPALFALTRRSRLDNLVGELSYPLYLCHYPVQGIVYAQLGFLYDAAHPEIWVALNVLASVAVAVLCAACITRPLDRRRYQITTWLAQHVIGRTASPSAISRPAPSQPVTQGARP
jgi:peptidoglycan/LPS O-acetylase OafA/YrhL